MRKSGIRDDTSMQSPCVFLLDDDPSVLGALARLLQAHGLRVVAFDSPQTFLERPRHEGPACVILDLTMPSMSGLDVQQAMLQRGDETATIFLSGTSDVRRTARAMRDGAQDFLVKPVDADELLAAIARALDRDRNRRERRDQQRTAAERLARLTAREREVCELVARGLLNKQIGYELRMAEKTVKVHRGRAMRKLEVESVPELVRLLSVLEPRT
jgi:FixJ family two-component response regulator